MKQPNKVGGGAQTNVVGLHFEQTTSLEEAIKLNTDYIVIGDFVYKGDARIGQLCGKNKLYKGLLEPRNIDYRTILSKKYLPDDAILIGQTLFIIEKKFQSGPGSVDEKLQTCDFKKKQYSRLLQSIDCRVEYIYVLNDWFRKPEYKDVHNYILSVGCQYFFNEIPLSFLGL